MTAQPTTDLIGASLQRPDAWGKVTGAATYPGDLVRPDMLRLKCVFAQRPHARILSIDTTLAREVVGVVDVLTAQDVPYNAYGLIDADQPVLCGNVVRFVGDRVALVVATTQEAADRAAKLVQIEWEDLPAVTDARAALEEGTTTVHESLGTNLLAHVPIRKGDAHHALEQADVVVEGEFTTSWQEHAFLQPEAGIAFWDDQERLVIETAGQWLHEDRRQIAAMLEMPTDQIVVRYASIGGAFGGREDLSIQHLVALAAWKFRRPVALVWDREESMIAHNKRHPMSYRCRWGAMRDGTITAVQSEVVADGGAYASTSVEVLKVAALFASGCYEIPNIASDGYAVYTNNVPCGAFRGFGAPQAHFAAEIMITKLAHALGMDPVALRLQNMYREGSIEPTQDTVPGGVSAVPVLERCVQEAAVRLTTDHGRPTTAEQSAVGSRQSAGRGEMTGGGKQSAEEIEQSVAEHAANVLKANPFNPFPESVDRQPQSAEDVPNEQASNAHGGEEPGLTPTRPTHLRRGIGIASGIKNIGYSFGFPEQSTATVELFGGATIDHAHVRVGAAEVGQGTHLAMRQIAATTLGLPFDKITMITDDSSEAPNAGSASASRLTLMAGRAVKDASEAALEAWQNEDRPAIATVQYRPPATTALDPVTTAGRPNYAYGYVSQAVEVEVNTLTGQVQVLKIISVHDVGKAINRQQVEGQIEGCLAQAVGYALMEHFQMRNGYVLTPHFSNYLLPTTLDMPTEIVPVILELADPNGPYGARGVAEMPLVPLAAAIAIAIYNATGAWVTDQPMIPERVLAALDAAGVGF